MLYVFYVDLGSTYSFEMELAMESVQVLMSTLAVETGIPEDKQVLLISNGEALDPRERVCGYNSAGTDTNPIFLFSKSTIESSIPPSPSLNLGSEANLKEQVEKSLNLPPTYETLVSRAQLASEFYSLSVQIAESCENLVCEQKLQQKGWSAVVANLESIASEFKARSSSVHQIYSEFLDSRTRYIELLDRFKDILPLLAKVPVLPCLISRQLSQVRQQDVVSLLDWISAQDNKNSLQDMVKQCIEAVEQFDESHLTEITTEVNQVIESLDNTNMKEIKGLDERLAGLQHILQNVQNFCQSQADMSQGLQQNVTSVQNVGRDRSVLSDLCASHQKQLLMMTKNHSHLRDIRKRCARAKDELSANLHTRLRWIMYIEKKICECDGTIIMYHENIRRIKRRLEIIEQVNEAPRMYILAVAEVVRRRSFSSQFQKWASKLCEISLEARTEETAHREEFELQFGQHFLQSLFSGLSDRPSRFVEKPPKPFDEQLPVITERDLQELKDQIPELASYLESSSVNVSMGEEGTKTSFLHSEELENVSDIAQFSVKLERTSDGITDKKVTSSIEDMSSSESKATQMSVDTSTQAEWTCSGNQNTLEQEGRQGATENYCTQDTTETTENPHDNNSNQRKKSNSDTSSEKSSAADDSDLVFRSAHEDYVTVFDGDLTVNFNEKEIPPDLQPVAEVQEDCAGLLEEASQTPTLASSGTQSTERSNDVFQRLEELQDQLRSTQESWEKTILKKETFEQLNTKVRDCVKDELKFLHQCLNDARGLVLEWQSKMKADVLLAVGNLKEKGDLCGKNIAQNTAQKTKEEFETELLQMNAKFEKEKQAFLEIKMRLDLEKNEILDQLKQLQAEKEKSECRHREETEKLSEIVADYKAKLEEHEGAAQKLQESKSRFEEDQQIRFNAIMMKLKREKEHAVLQAQEKIKELKQIVEQQEKEVKSLAMEKERITEELGQVRSAFCKREQELVAALQDKESKILNSEIVMKNKEAEFLQQIEKEKASALALLQVERELWEANRVQGLPGKLQETECVTDAVLEEDNQQKVKFLEEENKRLAENLSEQTLDKSGQLKQALDAKDQQIKTLKQQLNQMKHLSGASAVSSKMDKVSLIDFQSGDLILLVFDERYENYLALSTGKTLFFLHPDSMAGLDLATSGPKKQPWMLVQMTDKEYCQAKKPHNRFRVPVGTKFYRIQVKPCEL